MKYFILLQSEVNGHKRGLYIRDAKVFQQGRYDCIAITPTHEVSAGAYLSVKGNLYLQISVIEVAYCFEIPRQL